MTRIALVMLISFFRVVSSFAQNGNQELQLSDLALPTSPAFVLTDISPSVVQSPNTPKSFILGVMQSFDNASNGFPSNYSAEFTPYWWLRPSKRNVYSYTGLRIHANDSVTVNQWNGLKFINFSLAFLNKDLVADNVTAEQKVFSFGVRSNIFKIMQKGSGKKLMRSIDRWHDEALAELDSLLLQIDSAGNRGETEDILATAAREDTTSSTYMLVQQIKNLNQEKPLFSWDIAGAYAAYGINDSTWATGRVGAWTTLSSYIQIGRGESRRTSEQSYLSFNALLRYTLDNYSLGESGQPAKEYNLDFGGKITIELSRFSIGFESLIRNGRNRDKNLTRHTGIFSYRITDDIFLNGAFGENFDYPNKLIALFGINWGFGSEKIKL